MSSSSGPSASELDLLEFCRLVTRMIMMLTSGMQ